MGTVLGEEVSPQRRPRDQFLRMVTLVLHEGDTLVLGTCYMLGGMIASRRWFLVSSSLRLSTGDLPLSLSPILQPLGHSFRMFQNFSLSTLTPQSLGVVSSGEQVWSLNLSYMSYPFSPVCAA